MENSLLNIERIINGMKAETGSESPEFNNLKAALTENKNRL